MTAPDGSTNNDIFDKELEALYLQNRDMVMQAAYRVTRNEADAEDASQNVFLRLIENPELQRDLSANPKGYLYTAARNEAFHIIATRQRQRLTDEDVSSLEIQAPELSPDRQHDIQLVRAALATMNPDYAEILKLRYIDGHTCREIAKIRGKGVRAVVMDLYRARAEFKKTIRRQEKQHEIQQKKHDRNADPGVPKTSQK